MKNTINKIDASVTNQKKLFVQDKENITNNLEELLLSRKREIKINNAILNN